MSKLKIVLYMLIATFIFALIASGAIAAEKVKIIDGNKAVEGKLAPRFEGETLSGETFNLEDLRGEKCVIISFWATWCGPCKKELPFLEKFYEKHKDTCAVIAISKDGKRDKRLLENKIKELKLTFPVIHDDKDRIRMKLFPSRQIPYLVVISKEGIVKSMKMGCLNPENLVGELEKILGDDLKPKPKEETKAASEDASKAESETPKEEGAK